MPDLCTLLFYDHMGGQPVAGGAVRLYDAGAAEENRAEQLENYVNGIYAKASLMEDTKTLFESITSQDYTNRREKTARVPACRSHGCPATCGSCL